MPTVEELELEQTTKDWYEKASALSLCTSNAAVKAQKITVDAFDSARSFTILVTSLENKTCDYTLTLIRAETQES